MALERKSCVLRYRFVASWDDSNVCYHYDGILFSFDMLGCVRACVFICAENVLRLSVQMSLAKNVS